MGNVIFPHVVQRVITPLSINSTFANNTWADIIRACQQNKVPDSWAIGAQKAMTINGADYTIDIIGKNHDTYADESGIAPLTFQLHDCYGTKYRLHETEDNSVGWTSCAFRTKDIPTIIETLPEIVREGLREVTKKTGGGSANQTLKLTSDKLFLLSEAEIFGISHSTSEGEGNQYAYYTAGGSVIKYYAGTATSWWQRSPYKYTANSFGFVRDTGEHGNNGPSRQHGIAFAFCF